MAFGFVDDFSIAHAAILVKRKSWTFDIVVHSSSYLMSNEENQNVDFFIRISFLMKYCVLSILECNGIEMFCQSLNWNWWFNQTFKCMLNEFDKVQPVILRLIQTFCKEIRDDKCVLHRMQVHISMILAYSIPYSFKLFLYLSVSQQCIQDKWWVEIRLWSVHATGCHS